MSKERDHAALVARRKTCLACPTLVNPSAVAEGRLDSHEIGPYARRQGNFSSRVVLIAQDFVDVEAFKRVEGWPGEARRKQLDACRAALPSRNPHLAAQERCTAADLPEDRRVSTFPDQRPADALDDALHAIAGRYGERTTHVVAMQLEYPRSGEVR
jgi:hypothetical protein